MQRGANLTPLVRIPTVAAALFSTRHTSLDEIAPHARAAIPQDPSNASRAYRLLEKAGWIVLKPDANPVLMTRSDIARNIKQIDIIEMDSSNIPRTLQDIDYAVIPGSVAYASHIEQRNALLREDLIDNLYLTVAVKAGNDSTQWATQSSVLIYQTTSHSTLQRTMTKACGSSLRSFKLTKQSAC